MVVEAHAVDDGLPQRQAEKARLGVAWLWPRRHRADFDMAETQRRQPLDALAVLVEPGGQADPIGEFQAHDAHRRALRCSAGHRKVQRMRGAEAGEGQVVGGFRVEREEERAGELIEHGAILSHRILA